MQLSQKEIQLFQKKILSWYGKNKRDLPWRHTRNPYNILVSEVMSQQTQISRVIPKYEEWIQAFPTFQSLAKASIRDVLLHWSGLGYNRRALYLKKCAEVLVSQSSLRGVKRRSNLVKEKRLPRELHSLAMTRDIAWPQTEKELMQLPGIGKYTARALLCFAFNQQVAIVDTNVRKVILTQFPMVNDQCSTKEIEELAEQLLPKGKAYAWNQALMDYASQELKQHKIIIPKQSKFKDSDRYYRGQIIKLLLQKSFSEKNILQELTSATFSPERLEKILQTLIKDRLIKKTNGIYSVQ